VRNVSATTEAAGVAPSARTISRTIAAGSLRLPANITPMVSMKAKRARSMASGGACLRSKPVMKPAISCVGFAASASLAFGACGCCASAPVDAVSSVDALPPINDLRSSGFVLSPSCMVVPPRLRPSVVLFGHRVNRK